MALRIGVLRELAPGERRVACTPELVAKYKNLGAVVLVEGGAGRGSSASDQSYHAAGAQITDRATVLADANVVLAVQEPEPASLSGIQAGAWLIGTLNPYRRREWIESYAALGLECFAMDFLPRITRAQSMDVLSSQSNLAGYKAVLDAAHEFGRAFPMMMTAAGTIAAARVFVMGVGVAGLQAIATAKRLGAQVSATDVRPAVKEQIESLGAKPIFVDAASFPPPEGGGGYATEMSEQYRHAQANLVSAHISKQDIVITTALIPGKPAPRLVTDAQIATMKPGSVIVDLACEHGGNVEGSAVGEVIERHGVVIVAHRNVPSRLARDASALYARNLFNFLSAFWDKDAGRPVLPDGDEIVAATRLTAGGKVVKTHLLTPASA